MELHELNLSTCRFIIICEKVMLMSHKINDCAFIHLQFNQFRSLGGLAVTVLNFHKYMLNDQIKYFQDIRNLQLLIGIDKD